MDDDGCFGGLAMSTAYNKRSKMIKNDQNQLVLLHLPAPGTFEFGDSARDLLLSAGKPITAAKLQVAADLNIEI